MKKRFILRFEGQRDAICRQIMKLPADGTKVVVIMDHKTSRSLEQNSLYWMWVGIMCDETGYSKKELHDALRSHLLEPVTYPDLTTGELKSRLRSTTELSVKEFTAYLNAIEEFARDFMGCMLPRPEDQYAIAMGYRRVEKKAVQK